LQVRPGMPEVNFAIGYIYWKQQDYLQAQPWLEKELTIQPCYAAAHHYLGDIQRRTGNADAAAKRFRQALRCDANWADPYLGLGAVLEEQKQFGEAIRLLREFVRRQPDRADGRYRLARALQGAGRTAEAAAEFRKVEEMKAAANQKSIEDFQRQAETRALQAVLR
jgi:protein O-GlcNAc transferase